MTTLNSQQQIAVTTSHKKVFVLAGAGTGKTTVLTHRILYLLQPQIKEEDIVAFTFTNKAARQMKSKLESLLQKETKVILSTFHSFCYNHLLIPEFYQALGYTKPPEVLLESAKNQLIKNILHTYDKNQSSTPYVSAISKIKNQTETLEIGVQDRGLLNQIYQEYQNALLQSNSLDFDDMIPKFLEALKCNKELFIQTQYPYVLVDECQDINPIQYRFLEALTNQHQNLYMVGDEDQLIYSFRNSSLELLKQFHQQAEVIILNQNYRSTTQILALANTLISHNTNRIKKELYSLQESNILPIYTAYTTTYEEARTITQIIQELKIPYEDIAILYRNNDQSYPIEQELSKHHIPYTLYGGKPFFEHKEIQTILYTYRFLMNPNNEIALQMLYPAFIRLEFYEYQNFIKSPTTANLLEKLLSYSNLKLNQLGKTLEELKQQFDQGKPIFMEILEKLNYIQYLKDSNQQYKYDRLMAFKEMLEQEKNLETFFNHHILENEPTTPKGVTLMTIHKSKGLEFNTVFVISCNEGILPSPKDRNERLEEQRRLFYVAITRAKQRLYLSYSLTHFSKGKIFYLKPSCFLMETKQHTKELQDYFGNYTYHK